MALNSQTVTIPQGVGSPTDQVPNRMNPHEGPPLFDDPEGIVEPDTGLPLDGIPPTGGVGDGYAKADYLQNYDRISLAYPKRALDTGGRSVNLDDQFHGEGIPPGRPNEQPFQSGHTSIVIHNPAGEQGWGQDPAFRWPRYPIMENMFPGYSAGIFRRNGGLPEAKGQDTPMWERMQQRRDLMLRQAILHRLHYVVSDIPPHTPYVETITPMSADSYSPVMVSEVGVTPGM